MSTSPYPDGIDCSWLASDQVGRLGVFITAGIGPIPATALDSANMPIEAIEERLCQLPTVSSNQLLVTVKRPDSFIDLAERGFFVYDWTDIHRTKADELNVYESVAAPNEPIDIDALPDDLGVLARAMKLKGVEFEAGKAIDVRSFISCIEPI